MFLAFYNISFFKHLIGAYPPSAKNLLFILSVATIMASVIFLGLLVFSSKYTIKPLLILIFLLASLSAYAMDGFNTVIDADMIQNIFSSYSTEIMDQLTLKMAFYFFILGIIPSLIVLKIPVHSVSFKNEVGSKIKYMGLVVIIIISQLFIFGKNYASFFREHKILRYYSNPIQFTYALTKYVASQVNSSSGVLAPIGQDAKIPLSDVDRELIVLVVGETARADRFSLNGYQRQTNPLLSKEEVFSFSNVEACGTSTALSVPCMFSLFNRSEYSPKLGKNTENLLDVLNHAGINILWRDNNSDSKGVASRVRYEDFKNPNINPVCDVECRDEGMLAKLQEYIDKKSEGDIFIVLHQMGSHGPAYFKRYPASFEFFKPACQSNKLETCSEDEINNAYDNTIRYTDYFLSKVIELLKKNSPQFEASMIYMSDHGESLGEKGVFLHGLPFFMAPKNQKNVGAIFWFGSGFEEIDKEALYKKTSQEFSHDNLFHTILGIMEINTTIYNPQLDILMGLKHEG